MRGREGGWEGKMGLVRVDWRTRTLSVACLIEVWGYKDKIMRCPSVACLRRRARLMARRPRVPSRVSLSLSPLTRPIARQLPPRNA